MGGVPDRLHHVPEVVPAGVNARWRRIESAENPAAYEAIAAQSRTLGFTAPIRSGRAIARRAPARSRAPGRPRARLRRCRRHPADRVDERRRVARRDEQRALAVPEQLARGGRVGGDDGRPAGERLEDLVRDHAPGLLRGAEDPEGARRPVQLVRELLVLDPGHVLDVRRPVARGGGRAGRSRPPGSGCRAPGGRRRGSSRARAAGSACRRRAPARERSGSTRAGRLAPLRRRSTSPPGGRRASGRAPREHRCPRPRDQPRGRRCGRSRGARVPSRLAGLEAAAVVDERVPQRDERVEDDREAQPLRTAQVEVARVADDHRVGALARDAHELRLREEQSQRRGRADVELVPAVLPDRHVDLSRPRRRRRAGRRSPARSSDTPARTSRSTEPSGHAPPRPSPRPARRQARAPRGGS